MTIEEYIIMLVDFMGAFATGVQVERWPDFIAKLGSIAKK